MSWRIRPEKSEEASCGGKEDVDAGKAGRTPEDLSDHAGAGRPCVTVGEVARELSAICSTRLVPAREGRNVLNSDYLRCFLQKTLIIGCSTARQR